jgi:DNA-binding transcriptional regulator YdaS (Cro superfamily)
MKSNSNIDELLCSFIDGELPARQKTEVQRMAARDPEVAQRLRQLQKCHNLVSVLPRAEAPDDMIEQIRLSLERRTLLGERPAASNRRAGTWHLRLRYLTAAAAMIALLGVLGLVVYQIVSPVPSVNPTGPVAVAPNPPQTPSSTVTVVSESGFAGRLELQTAALVRADAYINNAIKDNGLSEMVESQTLGNKRIFHVACSREALGRLVADLNEVWRNSKSATLVVEADRFNDSVVVRPATLQQTARIISQDSAEACVAVAKEIAILDSFVQDMPGRNVVAAAGGDLNRIASLSALPRPVETSGDLPTRTVAPATEEKVVKARLTIVLVDARP